MTITSLNEQVARKLHGDEWRMWSAEDYSHSIAAAWEIPGLAALIRLVDGRWHARFDDPADVGSYYEVGIYPGEQDYGQPISEADTAPMAICLAFLKLPEDGK